MKDIGVYWWRRPKGINLGDSITPFLVSAVSGRNVVHASIDTCDLLAVGSVLGFFLDATEFRQRQTPVHVWGAGLMDVQKVVTDKYNYAAVRGPLTRALIQSSSQLPLGDPGLLVSRVWKANPVKTHKWGIIAHHSQMDLPIYRQLLEHTPHSVRIDFTDENIDLTLQQLSACEFIVSTSLHGLVIADSYRIPSIWLLTKDIHPGKSFKFYDYFASVGRPDYEQYDAGDNFNLDRIDFSDRSTEYFRNVEKVQDRIQNCFPHID